MVGMVTGVTSRAPSSVRAGVTRLAANVKTVWVPAAGPGTYVTSVRSAGTTSATTTEPARWPAPTPACTGTTVTSSVLSPSRVAWSVSLCTTTPTA